MAQASGSLHEARESLGQETVELHRAIMSLMEELEAVDWYAQRVDATSDPELRAILAHNRDEEKEHASMLLEWIRRRDPSFDEQLRTYLFREGPIVEREHGGGKDSG
jgi:ferritin-like protein